MLMEFHTGFVAAYDIRRQLVMKRGFVAENYIRRGAFVVDVICVLYVIVVVDLVVRVLVILDSLLPTPCIMFPNLDYLLSIIYS